MKKVLALSGSLIISHLSAVLISLILSVVVMAVVKDNIICSVITMLLYVSMIYSAGWSEGFRDSRKVGESFPNLKRAFVVSAVPALITLILLIIRITIYKINPTDWAPYGKGYEMIEVKSAALTIFDVIYRLWNYFFVGFMNDEIFISYLVPIIFPVIIYPAGYAVGLTRFSIIEKYMPQLLYKPKKKKRK